MFPKFTFSLMYAKREKKMKKEQKRKTVVGKLHYISKINQITCTDSICYPYKIIHISKNQKNKNKINAHRYF